MIYRLIQRILPIDKTILISSPFCFILKTKGGFVLLQQYASCIVDFLYQGATLDKAKRAIYQYGMELTLSMAAAVLSILLLAAFFGNFFWGIVFLIVFISFRLPGGGYHASSYRNCFLLTNSVFLVSFAFSSVFVNISNAIVVTLLLGSDIIIWVLSPISNPHHPVSERIVRKNRNIVRGMVICGTLFILLGKWIFLYDSLFCMYSASIAAVAVMMILAKKGGTKNE